MFSSRRRIKNDRAVDGDRAQEIDDDFVFGVSKKSVVPRGNDVLLHQRFDAGEIGDHPLFGVAINGDHVTADSDLDRIAVAMQMPALAVVIGNPVTGVEFEPAGNAHQKAGLARKSAKYSIALRN